MSDPKSGDLEELYQSIILDHNRRPQNFRAMPAASAHADGVNPMCGDQLTVWLKMNGDVVSGLRVRDLQGEREPDDADGEGEDARRGREDF